MKLLLATTAIARVIAFMSDTCETVVVMTENGPVIVNKSDVDAAPDAYEVTDMTTDQAVEWYAEKRAELVAQIMSPDAAQGVPAEPQTPAPVPTPEPAADEQKQPGDTNDAGTDETPPAPPAVPSALATMKIGSKYFVTDIDGNPVQIEGINPNGYRTQTAAHEAIAALNSMIASAD